MFVDNTEQFIIINQTSNWMLLYSILNSISKNKLVILLKGNNIDSTKFNKLLWYLIQTKQIKALDLFIEDKGIRDTFKANQSLFIPNMTEIHVYKYNSLLLQNLGYISEDGYLLQKPNRNILIINRNEITWYDTNVYCPQIQILD